MECIEKNLISDYKKELKLLLIITGFRIRFQRRNVKGPSRSYFFTHTQKKKKKIFLGFLREMSDFSSNRKTCLLIKYNLKLSMIR